MPRSARDSKLDTRTSRLKLRVGTRHYLPIGKGLALGYRRTSDGYGMWSLRIRGSDHQYRFHTIGKADDFQDANGYEIFDFFQAQAKAREHFDLSSKAANAHRPQTVEEAAKRYLEWYEKHRRAFKATQNTVTAHILPAFGTTLVSELTANSIRAWHHKLAEQGPRRRTALGDDQQLGARPLDAQTKRARKSTANRILTVFKALLNKAYEDDLVADDSAWRRVRPFKNVDDPIIRFLTDVESRRLVNASTPALRRLIKAALFSGARYGELTRLRATDFNPKNGSIFIQPSKSDRGRHVPLNAEGLAFFKEVATGKTGDAFLFTRPDGEPWGKNHQVRPLSEACAKAKILPAISFHELRHTYASALAQRAVDLLTISKLLGHADTRITSRHYAHLADKTLSEAVKSLPSFGHKRERKLRAIA